jgi:hypothetical protein
MPPGHLAELESGDEGMLEGFLGEEPVIDGADALTFEHFWRCRRATPSDQPLDLERALSLYTRLYGDVDAHALCDALGAMDGAFAQHVAGEIERKSKKSTKGKGG